MKSILVILFISVFVHLVRSQVSLEGQVVSNNTNKPIEFASVRILNCKDSSVLAGQLTNERGTFNLILNDSSCVIVQIKFVGFVTYSNIVDLIPNSKKNDLGKIKLNELVELDQINLKADLEVLKAGIDKKVYNVSEDLTLKGGSANDVLNRLPSVEVDQEGNIMLRGEGRVTILIDGKQSSISGGETLLDALPAGAIDRIEIVTNPSAKYDPDGTSGIINIVLKKNKLKGINLYINSSNGSGSVKNGNSTNTNIGLAYRAGRLNIYGSYSLNYYEGFRNNYSYTMRENSSGSLFNIGQSRTGSDFSLSNNFKSGLDYNIDDNHEINFSFSGIQVQRDRTGDLWNSLYDELDSRIDLWNRNSFDPSQSTNVDLDLNYKSTFFSDKADFTFNIHKSIGQNKIQGFYVEHYFTPDSMILESFPLNQQLFNMQNNNVLSSQWDLSIVFPELKGRFESGMKLIYGNQFIDTYSERLDSTTNLYLQDTLANFIYEYKEKIYSIYSIYGQQIGKLKFQAGLRGEIAYQIPELISQGILIENPPYLNIFPSAHLRYEVIPKLELSVGYSKRINRPSSSNLNPFTNYSDPFNLRRGNPYLKPEYVDSYDFTLINDQKKYSLSYSIYFRNSRGVISRIKEYYDNNTSAATFDNIAQTYSVGSEVFSSIKITSSFKITGSWNGNYIWYFANENETVSRQGYYHNFKFNSSLDFWKKSATLQVSYVYNGKRITLQGIAQRTGPTDIAFEKRFKDSKWSIGTRVSDVFNVQGFYMDIDQPGVSQISTYKWLTRRYYLLITYKFGKIDNKLKQKLSPNTDQE